MQPLCVLRPLVHLSLVKGKLKNKTKTAPLCSKLLLPFIPPSGTLVILLHHYFETKTEKDQHQYGSNGFADCCFLISHCCVFCFVLSFLNQAVLA